MSRDDGGQIHPAYGPCDAFDEGLCVECDLLVKELASDCPAIAEALSQRNTRQAIEFNLRGLR